MRPRTLKYFVLISVLLVFASLQVTVVSAQAVSWTVVSMNTVGCNNGQTQFTTLVENIPAFPTTLRFRTIVDAGGLRYMDEDAGNPGSNGLYGWSLYNSSSGGPTTATFPIPPNTPITVTFALIDGVGGPFVTSQTIVITQCNGGVIVVPEVAAETPPCPYPLPAGSVVYSVPAGAPAFWDADLSAQTNFSLPAGTWYISEFVGDFAKVWIACQASPIYIPSNAVAQ